MLLPILCNFRPASIEEGQPEFRFGVTELAQYIGVATDMAQFILAVLGIVAALRSAGGGKVGVRTATKAEPIEIDAEMDDDTIRAKLSRNKIGEH